MQCLYYYFYHLHNYKFMSCFVIIIINRDKYTLQKIWIMKQKLHEVTLYKQKLEDRNKKRKNIMTLMIDFNDGSWGFSEATRIQYMKAVWIQQAIRGARVGWVQEAIQGATFFQWAIQYGPWWWWTFGAQATHFFHQLFIKISSSVQTVLELQYKVR